MTTQLQRLGLATGSPDRRENFLGRYLLADGREFRCTVSDISSRGIALIAPEKGAVGELIVVYIDRLGRLAGEIVRILADGLIVKLTMSTRASKRFAQRLCELPENRPLQNSPESRREPRVELEGEELRVVSLDGTIGKIVNLSMTGAEVKVSARPAIGTLVQLGRTRGKIVRHTPCGVGIEFVDVPADATLSGRFTEIELTDKLRQDRGKIPTDVRPH